MPWTSLRERLHHLPLVLAGPILRRTESTSVTVWLALRQACDVTLQVYATDQGNGLELGALQLHGQTSTVAVGKALHLVAGTAQTGTALQPGQIYAYDLIVQLVQRPDAAPQRLLQVLNTDHAPRVPISYFEHGLPTFLLPPEDVNDLKILHGSCRKTHGGGIDALVILDDLLEQSAPFPQQRPQQLFCTGDQIYGDDVADPWLFALTDAGDTLLGWEEDLPIDQHPSATVPSLKAKHLPPGERTGAAETLAGFTAGLPHKPDRTNSHLLSFGEYCAAYLFAWSPVLWPQSVREFPTGKERFRDPKKIQTWDAEVETLKNFWQPLWKVRRALANIATYMIFDDHDISDDWYLNQAWCMQVLGKPLGRRVVQNGLLAYALAQAWGNEPEQFASGQAGAKLLRATEVWSASAGTDETAAATIARLVGLPAVLPDGMPQFRRDAEVWILDHHPDSLRWHYSIQSHCHEVLVLDSRTWRGYPLADQVAPPMLLCPTAFDQQIRWPLRQSRDQNLLTLVVAPTNLIHLRLIDWAQQWSLKQGKVFDNDVGDAWNLHKEALSALLAALFESRDQVVVLSGDIHYGFAARLNYWTESAQAIQQQSKGRAQVLIQLTSSAFKNAEFKTQLVQTKLKALLLEPPQEWVGWHQIPELWEAEAKFNGTHWRQRPPTEDLPIESLKTRLFQPPTWKLAAARPESLPDWHYRIEWIHRQPARSLPWGRVGWLTVPHRRWFNRLLHGLGWFWRNRWLQEGPEVVGASNIGLVQFRDFDLDQPPIVIQDLYWSPPWQPTHIVVSRFEGALYPDDDATPFPLLPLARSAPQISNSHDSANDS